MGTMWSTNCPALTVFRKKTITNSTGISNNANFTYWSKLELLVNELSTMLVSSAMYCDRNIPVAAPTNNKIPLIRNNTADTIGMPTKIANII